MSDLTAALLMAIAERRAIAEAATPGTWKLWGMQVRADPVGDGNLDTSLPVATTTDARGLRTWNAAHIAANDPTFALPNLDAWESVVHEHWQTLDAKAWRDGRIREPICGLCHHGNGFGYRWPCPTLLAAARVFRAELVKYGIEPVMA